MLLLWIEINIIPTFLFQVSSTTTRCLSAQDQVSLQFLYFCMGEKGAQQGNNISQVGILVQSRGNVTYGSLIMTWYSLPEMYFTETHKMLVFFLILLNQNIFRLDTV